MGGVRRDSRALRVLALAAVAALAALAIWLALTIGLVGSTLETAGRAQVAAQLMPRLPLVVMTMALLALGVAAAVLAAWRRWVAAPEQLLEQSRVLLDTDARTELKATATPALAGLASTLNQLARQREALRTDIARQVEVGSRSVAAERSRLAALMSELTQSVVVCNLDGRVLLYNTRARLQFRALSAAPTVAGGSELIGLGRSIYTVMDRELVAHALENIQQRLARGAAYPSAQFVTVTPGGQLLRAQMAPVREAAPGVSDAGEAAAPSALSGFVLLLDNITSELERDIAQDQLLLELTEGSRASLGNLQAAVELLDDPAVDAPTRERFLAVVREEAQAMGARLRDLSARSAAATKTRWPLEEMLGSDLVAAARRRIEATCPIRTGTVDVDATVWLKVDSFALLQALAFLANRLVEEFTVRALQLRLQPRPGDAAHAQLDLIWSGQAMSTETVMAWESEAMNLPGQASALSVRDVIQRHQGEFWFERERVRQQAFFRFLLPLADAGAEDAEAALAASAVHHESRPEYYDFDLFQPSESHHALDERRLAELTYTVFDTETTGLDPAGGDRIIQIGAVRIVNGRVLRQESFDQLIDPERSIPPAGIPIHGITPEMVRGQPKVASVLPAFHAYARDTVLVAHNAAFDLRFLQLEELRSGVRFEHPVLDTLLLSALVHAQQDSHRLEAIAERMGITVIGRHTALGDALVTADVFLKLVPLLAAMGIHTLGQARAAAQQTWYARLRY
jgi:DNA polymerase-3 subunit epsilon